MEETYTCLCGRQEFYIDDIAITCRGCGRMFGLIIKNNKMEEPKDFNRRVRKEAKEDKKYLEK